MLNPPLLPRHYRRNKQKMSFSLLGISFKAFRCGLTGEKGRSAMRNGKFTEDLLSGGGFLDDEGHALRLVLAVKGQAPDVCVRVGSLALFDLSEHLGWIGAPKHRQLPQRPVPPVVVPGHPTVLPANACNLQNNQQWKKKEVAVLASSK